MTSRLPIACCLLALIACRPTHTSEPRVTTSPPARPLTRLTRLTREPAPASIQSPGTRIVFHDVRLDDHGMLLPAFDVDAPFAEVARLGFRAFEAIPATANGHKPYFVSSMFKPNDTETFATHTWLNNPTGLAAMLVRATTRYYAWSGDRAPVDAARALVDHVLAHGLTSATDSWSRVPYASANAGELDYHGGDDPKYCDDHDACGRGDGRGFLEPDKVGELGHALVLLHRFTGEQAYLDAAIRCADALATHVAQGDADHSPWPFRVDATTGKIVREPYTSNWIYTLAFFDALAAIGKSTSAYRAARDAAWAWLRAYPLVTMQWQGFFEDIPIHVKPGENPNQYSAGEMARFLLAHRDQDPDAIAHARAIVRWIATTFAIDVEAPNVGTTPGHWYGAEVISEQRADMAKMGSHTARFASVLARLYEATGDPELRERARRSFAWATYCIDKRGVVKVGPDDREGYWFSDGYGDFMIHFLDGIASVPAWAPSNEAHVLRTDDVLVDVAYAPRSLHYKGTARGAEEIRVPASPTHVKIGDVDLDSSKPGVLAIEPMPNGGALVTVIRGEAQAIAPIAIEW